MLPNTALDTESLRSRLKLRHIQSQNLLVAHHPQVTGLLEGVKRKTAKVIASGAAVASLSLISPQTTPIRAALMGTSVKLVTSAADTQFDFKESLKNILPSYPKNLTWEQEQQISSLLHSHFGLHAGAELEGNRLNDTYGFIGVEQHLPRYPGDSAAGHGRIIEAGITPGRGAWGYFAWSKKELTPQMVELEKYYVAVQTLYLPDWSARLSYLRDWYKYRKVVVVNPRNGKIIIADIADSGPSWWTGKKFGGSPEVMEYLELQDGKARGAVVVFFVDDPDNKVNLGPLEYKLEGVTGLLKT